MTRIPADYREFVRVSVDLPANPKLAMIDNPAAGWAYVVSLCYCGQHLTDGSFPMGVLLRLAGVKPAVAKALIGAGLWHQAGHACDRCPQPMSGTGIVHDYLVHQRSSGEAKALRDARREAGRKGAASRWDSNGDGKSHSNGHSKSHANSEANGTAEPWQTDAKPMAEVEVEEEKNPPIAPPRGAPRKRGHRIPDDFAVTAEMVAWTREHCPNVDGRAQTEAFIDHFRAAPGQRGVKLDWLATWRNWMRTAAERAPRNGSPRYLAPVPAALPKDPSAAFADIRERGDAKTVERLVGRPYIPKPQPPSDETPQRVWDRAQALAFIDFHRDALIAALAEKGKSA
jgi:hypothetical protein